MEVIIPIGKGHLRGEGAAHCKVYEHAAVIVTKTAEPMVMTFGLRARIDPGNHKFDGGSDQYGKGQFLGRGARCKV